MDPSYKKVKPSLPPKPSFLNTKNKCKSLSSYHVVRNNRMAIRILASTEGEASSTLNLSETSPSNEDVFNNTNGINNVFSSTVNINVFNSTHNLNSRRYFQESERMATSHADREMNMHSKSSLTLPVGLRPNLGQDNIAPPARLLYRSGGTVRVTRTAPSQSFTSPDKNMQSLRPIARDGNSFGVSGKPLNVTLNDQSLEFLIPLVPSPILNIEPSPTSADDSTFVDMNALSNHKKSGLLQTEKSVDSNNNSNHNNNSNINNSCSSNNSSNTGSSMKQVASCSSISAGNEAGRSFKEIRDSFASPPLARISLKKPKTEKQKLASKTKSMFSKNSETKSSVSATTSSNSIERSVAKNEETSLHDNLDVLIPVFANSSTRSSRKLSRKSRMQTRAHSECNFNREKVLSEVPRDDDDEATTTARSSCSSSISEAPLNVEPSHHYEVASIRRDMKLPVKKPSTLYLPMDKVFRDPRRKYASSCTDLMQQSKFGRVGELINESLGERKKQADTLPYVMFTGTSFSSSNNSSFSGEDAFSPMTPEPRSSTNEGESHDSDCSSDNYGTLSDDDYISREDVDGKSANEKPSAVDSRGSTLTNNRENNSCEVARVIDESRADDSFSFDSSSFDDFSNRNSELMENFGNNESNNEIKMLSLSGSVAIPNIGHLFSPQFGDLSSSFFSSTSSATSSNLSLNLFSTSAKETQYNPLEKKEHVYESLPDIYQLGTESKKKQKDPFLVAKEIMTSEEKFIEVLKLLNEDFPNFIKSERAQGKASDGPADVKQLFHDLPNLQQVNKELLKELKQRIENWDKDPRIADVFIKTGHFLKLYTNYIKSFSRVVQEFDNVRRRNPDFDRSVLEFENSPVCNMLALRHYMLKPIQRIPQYKLLLQEYLKCLSPQSPDYNNAKDAIPIVAGVSEHANESVRNWENQCKIINIQSMLGGYQVVQPDRKFIKEGRLMKLSRKEMQARMFFLFNDLLLYTTPLGTNSYRVNQAISLDGLTVSASTTEDMENEFNIISVERSFTVAASSKEEKDQWVSALERAVLEHMETKINLEALKLRRLSCQDSTTPTGEVGAPKPSRGVAGNGVISMYESNFKVGERAPVWIQDERASMCMACTREFSVTFRRHHCRGCGKIVCSNCSKCRAPLKYNGFKPARVCVDCYNYLKKSIIYEECGIISATTPNESGSDSAAEHLISKDPPALNQPNTPFGMRNLSLLFKGRNLTPLSRSLSKPSILTEVQAFDSSSEMSGFLFQLEKKKWKKLWFVLKNQVLYTFKAMQDKAAIRTMPLLSYNVQDGSSGLDNNEKTFEIFHDGLPPITLRAETSALKLKWIDALQKAMTV